MFRIKGKKYLRKKSDLFHDYLIFGLFILTGYMFFRIVNKKMISDDEKEPSKKKKRMIFFLI
jgi:hypothetical protein